MRPLRISAALDYIAASLTPQPRTTRGEGSSEMGLGNGLLHAEDAEALAEVRKGCLSAYLCETLRALCVKDVPTLGSSLEEPNPVAAAPGIDLTASSELTTYFPCNRVRYAPCERAFRKLTLSITRQFTQEKVSSVEAN